MSIQSISCTASLTMNEVHSTWPAAMASATSIRLQQIADGRISVRRRVVLGTSHWEVSWMPRGWYTNGGVVTA